MSGNDRRIVLSTEAQEDLLDIWHYGANEWSAEQADRHLRELDGMLQHLMDNPHLGRRRDDLVAGLRSAFVRPHLIFYRQSSMTIQIVRILHHRLDTVMQFRQ